MKYFTKEELDFIADELINNPCRETIKKLNDRYNGNDSENKSPTWIETNSMDNHTYINHPSVMNNDIGQKAIVSEDNLVEDKSNELNNHSIYRPGYEQINTPIWNPINNTEKNIYNASLESKMIMPEENNTNMNNNISSIPSLNIQSEPTNLNDNNKPNLNIPNLSTPDIKVESSGEDNFNNRNNSINNSIYFDGNPWMTNNSSYNFMMQTTDNFNNSMESSTNQNPSTEPMPFFQIGVNTQENQIPVSVPPKEEGPTMLGQFEQNYNNKATQ